VTYQIKTTPGCADPSTGGDTAPNPQKLCHPAATTAGPR